MPTLLPNQPLELRMLLKKITGNRTNHIHLKLIVPRILKRSLRQHPGNPSPAQARRHLGMPERHPSMPIHFEFEISSLALILKLKSVPRNLRSIGTYQLNRNSFVRNSFTCRAASPPSQTQTSSPTRACPIRACQYKYPALPAILNSGIASVLFRQIRVLSLQNLRQRHIHRANDRRRRNAVLLVVGPLHLTPARSVSSIACRIESVIRSAYRIARPFTCRAARPIV